jgi:hypothetical protein
LIHLYNDPFRVAYGDSTRKLVNPRMNSQVSHLARTDLERGSRSFASTTNCESDIWN